MSDFGNKINVGNPIKNGEWLYFTDPDQEESSGWFEVVDAPLIIHDLNSDEFLTDDMYQDSIIKLSNEDGSELETYVHELSRHEPVVEAN